MLAAQGNHEQKLSVAEMMMLRMMCGVTRWDRLRNEYVRGSVGVDSIRDKLAQSRLSGLDMSAGCRVTML